MVNQIVINCVQCLGANKNLIPLERLNIMKSVGIFGFPVSHSISPVFQQAAFDYLGIDAQYKHWCVQSEAIQNRISELRASEFLGCNVTIPHKVLAKEFVDTLDPLARKIGSINTIVNRDGTLVGYNTDINGFIRSLVEYGNYDPTDKPVLVIGAGGAARAAVYGLARRGASRIVIANRTIEKADSIAAEFHKGIVFTEKLERVNSLIDSSDFSLIVNCSSLGMKGGGSELDSPLKFENLNSKAFIYDMIYTPGVTPFLALARKNKNPYLGGLSMLVMQGAESFELWTGQRAPVDVMFAAAEKAIYSDR